jgi:hypothetical protein
MSALSPEGTTDASLVRVHRYDVIISIYLTIVDLICIHDPMLSNRTIPGSQVLAVQYRPSVAGTGSVWEFGALRNEAGACHHPVTLGPWAR